MPKYGYYCKACDESYEVRMSPEEQGAAVPRCPKCGDEGMQELYAVSPDAGAGGSCCGGSRGCCG